MNAHITRLSPYPGLVLNSQDSVRYRYASADVEDKAADSANLDRRTARHVNAILAPESVFNQSGSRQQLSGERTLDEVNERPAVSGAGVLMQLINKMGGSGVHTGPGRVFDFVI
ncbi:MAG: hypothetical protein ACE5GZ_12925 [Gammaproteobacteria bacterium]